MDEKQPLTLAVEQAAEILGVARSTAYELVRRRRQHPPPLSDRRADEGARQEARDIARRRLGCARASTISTGGAAARPTGVGSDVDEPAAPVR